MAENVQKILSIELKATSAINGIRDLNAQIDANKTKMRELADANQKGSLEYAKLEQQTKALSKSKQVLSRETQNEIRLEYEEKGSLNSLRAELANLTKQYDQLSRAERENINVGGKLKNQINQVTNEIKAAEEGTQRYYRNVGNYQNAILNALGINGRFAQSIMGLTSAQGGFSGAMSAMGTSVKAFGASLMSLMANPVFLAIAGIAGVGMAFKWFYDYNEGLAEATRLTREFTGLQGEELVGFRNSIQATAEVMGRDFKETLQTVDTLMSQFHIDGKQALDVINNGFAAGADLNGDMLQKLQQYAPTFHDAGIQANQMMAIITQTRSGIFSDQGLEAIKQASARIREMSNQTKQSLQGIGIDADEMSRKLASSQMTTFDAIQEVSAALRQLPDDSQEVGNVMADVFGRQGKFASQEMIESLAEMSTSLEDVKAQTGEYGELLLENISTEEELNNVTAALFDMTDNGWENIKQQAIIYAKKALVAVVKGLIDVANWFIRLYNSSLPVRTAVNMIATQFKVLWSVVKFAFNNIINGFKTIGRGISAVVNGFNQAGNAIKAFGQGVALIFKGISKMSWEMIEQGWHTISSGMKGAAISAFDGLESVVTEGAADWGDAAMEFGKEIGGYVMDGIKNTMSGGWEEIKIPAFAGGGGGSSSSSYGGGGSDTNTNSGGSGSGGRKGGSRGGKSRRTGGKNRRTGDKPKPTPNKSGMTPEEKAEKERQDRMAALIKKGNDALQKAYEEEAKVTEEGIKEMYQKRAEAIEAEFNAINTKTEEEAEAMARAKQALLDANAKEMEKTVDKFRADAEKKRKEDENKARQNAKVLVEAYMASDAVETTQEHLNWLLRLNELEMEAELAQYEDNEEMKGAIILKYQKKEEDIRREHLERINNEERTKIQQRKAYSEMMLAATEEGDAEHLEWRLKALANEMAEELLMYEDNEQMKAAIREKYQLLERQARQEHVQAVIDQEQYKYQALTSFVGGMGQLLEKFGQENEDAAKAAKMLALGEIMISQAVAIANAVKAGSNASNPWQMIAQIAASVVAVTVAMADAFASLDNAKFATGGYIRGAGTGTSDSIPVRVSNGESIMNANTTAMFGGLLSSLNQLGGGVPIQAQQTASSVRGEDMLARAVARGVAMLPAPVVSVEDINRGQRQVEVMNKRATL